MKEIDIHSIIVIYFIKLGIVPYYPGDGILTKPDYKSTRKFRKIWRKAGRDLNMMEKLVSKNAEPSMKLKGYRQAIVYSWIKNKLTKKEVLL